MESILYIISDVSILNNLEINIYNKEFFSKHIDIEKLNKIIIIKEVYNRLISLFGDRFSEQNLNRFNEKDEEVKKAQKRINTCISESQELERRRVELSKKQELLYSEDKFDENKITTIENELNDISKQLVEKKSELKKLINTKRSLMGQKRKNDAFKRGYDSRIKDEYKILSKHLKDFDISSLSILDVLTSEELLKEYEEGLKQILPNEKQRKTYLNYFKSILTSEVSNTKSIIETAVDYQKRANEDNLYHLADLDEKNNQMFEAHHILSDINYIISFDFNPGFFDNMKKGSKVVASEKMISAFNEIKGFIDKALEYALNYEKYRSDSKLEQTAFNELISMINKIYERNNKKRPKILGIIPRNGFSSIESFAYEDVAIKLYEWYLLKIHDRMKKHSNKKELNASSNPKFKKVEGKKEIVISEVVQVQNETLEDDTSLRM